MTINDIMKNLEECLEFSSKHSFHTINMDVVSIDNAQLDINNMFKVLSKSMQDAVRTKAEQYIVDWKARGIIKDYVKTDDSIHIIPLNVKLYESYLGGKHHYELSFIDPNAKDIA